jgi:hypothetical protein
MNLVNITKLREHRWKWAAPMNLKVEIVQENQAITGVGLRADHRNIVATDWLWTCANLYYGAGR